jgi:hypothetical protein
MQVRSLERAGFEVVMAGQAVLLGGFEMLQAGGFRKDLG